MYSILGSVRRLLAAANTNQRTLIPIALSSPAPVKPYGVQLSVIKCTGLAQERSDLAILIVATTSRGF
jgi:hypothetical protein